MYKRVVGRCKNQECRQSFGIVRDLLHDEKGVLMARCPFCNRSNKVGIKEFSKLLDL